MQIDYNFTKQILETMQKRQSHYISTATLREEAKPKYTDIDEDDYVDLFYGHLRLLKDEGLIEEVFGQNLGISHTHNGDIDVSGCYIRLTSKGYNFKKFLNKDGAIERLKKFTLTEGVKIGEAIITNSISDYINKFI